MPGYAMRSCRPLILRGRKHRWLLLSPLGDSWHQKAVELDPSYWLLAVKTIVFICFCISAMEC